MSQRFHSKNGYKYNAIHTIPVRLTHAQIELIQALIVQRINQINGQAVILDQAKTTRDTYLKLNAILQECLSISKAESKKLSGK